MTKTDRIAALHRFDKEMDELFGMTYEQLIAKGKETNSNFHVPGRDMALKALIYTAVVRHFNIGKR